MNTSPERRTAPAPLHWEMGAYKATYLILIHFIINFLKVVSRSVYPPLKTGEGLGVG